MSHQGINKTPGIWLRFYLAFRALRRGPRQFLLMGIPLMMIVGWVTLAYFFLSFHFGYFQGFGSTRSILSYLAVGVRFGLPSTIMILIGVYFLLNRAHAYVFALYQLAPETKSEIRKRIWHRLWGWYGFFSFQSYIIVNDTKLELSNHWMTWFGGPAFLLIYDGFAVYLERGNSFSRVVGAGFPMAYLDPHETVKAIVDLRPQIRDGQVNAWTKDGIRIKFKIRVEFQVEPGSLQNTSDANLVYSFNPLAVRKAVEYTSVSVRDGKLQESDWRESTVGTVTGLVERHVWCHRIDELFLRNGGGGQMLSPSVITELMEKTNARLTRAAGVRILSLQISDVIIHPGVFRRWLDVWKAEMLKDQWEEYEIDSSTEFSGITRFYIPLPSQIPIQDYFDAVMPVLESIDIVYSVFAILLENDTAKVRSIIALTSEKKEITALDVRRFVNRGKIPVLSIRASHYGSDASFDLLGLGKVLEILVGTVKEIRQGKHNKIMVDFEERGKELELEKTLTEIATQKVELIQKISELKITVDEKKSLISLLLPSLHIIVGKPTLINSGNEPKLLKPKNN